MLVGTESTQERRKGIEELARLARQSISAAETRNWLFYCGDHWQGGTGWVGPMFMQNGAALSMFMQEVERTFIFYNAVREITRRALNAVVSKEPQMSFALARPLEEHEEISPVEEENISYHTELWRRWIDGDNCVYRDERGVLRRGDLMAVLRESGARLIATGRAYLRVLIPKCCLDEGGALELVELGEALGRIKLELCEIPSAAMVTNTEDMAIYGVYYYEDAEGHTHVEITYQNDSGETVIEHLDGVKREYDLGGNLMHCEITQPPLVTDSIIAQQKDLNRTLSMGGRNMNMAGFRERVMIDLQEPGEYEEDPKTGKRTFVPKPFPVGAGTVSSFKSHTYKSQDGGLVSGSPQYIIQDPVGSAMFDEAVENAKKRIRDEADQSHVEMSGLSTASGRSRELARHEFQQSLGGAIHAINELGRWVMEVVFRLAYNTSTTPDMSVFDELVPSFEVQADIGPVSSSDRAEDRAAVKDGIMSRETAQMRMGIDDTEAEDVKITLDGDTSPARRAQKIEDAVRLIAAGANDVEAYQVAGFSEDDAKRLVRLSFTTEVDE